MKPLNPLSPTQTQAVDADLAEQAQPGHGIPSQDPTAGAQTGLTPEEAERETNSALVGGGVVSGATAGVVVGAAIGGPAGGLVGAAVGAVTGALGGAAAGAAVSPEDTDAAHPTPSPATGARRTP